MISKAILDLRKEKKMTQQEFSELFNVTRQSVSNWENNKSYPDLETLIAISDHFSISLDSLIKEDKKMVKTIDSSKKYKKGIIILVSGILLICFALGIYVGICKYQHDIMYDKVLAAGFKREKAEEFHEKYLGNYGLTEEGVDYLVWTKTVGEFQLDNQKFCVSARKGNQEITIFIDAGKNITLALYPGDIKINSEGEVLTKKARLSSEQQEHLEVLLQDRKEEVVSIVKRALEFWEEVN